MRSQVTVHTRGRGLHEVTDMVRDEVRRSGVHEGLCCVYLRHTSASLVIQENADPDVLRDLNNFFSRMVTDGDPDFFHRSEGPDDMPAHIRSALTQTHFHAVIRSNIQLYSPGQSGLFKPASENPIERSSGTHPQTDA
mgnify:CR=1 FL=1